MAVSARRLEWQLREDCRKGNIDSVRKLVLETGVNVNACDDLGQTPLWIASFHGRQDIVLFLLSSSARTEAATEKEGYTPLWVACQEGHVEVVRLLLNAGANPNIQSKVDGATPMYIAAQKGMSDIVKLLIAANANLDSTMSYGTTPLWIACQNGHADVVKLLLTYPSPSRKRPNTEAQEANSRATALYIAAQKGYSKIVETLLQNDAFVNAQTKEGATPVYIACQNGHFDVVRALLQFKADLQIKYKGTGTPLLIAMQRGHQEIVDLLQKALRRTGSGDLPAPFTSPRAGDNAEVSATPPSTHSPLYKNLQSPMNSPTSARSAPVAPTSPISQVSPQAAPSRSFPHPPTKSPHQHSVHFKFPDAGTTSEPIGKNVIAGPVHQDPPPQQSKSSPIQISPRLPTSPSHPTVPLAGSDGVTSFSSSAPGRVMTEPEQVQLKTFCKLFVKIDGVNRRLSDLRAHSLEDFANQIRTQLTNVNIPSSPQFELFDEDAQDYFLIEEWSVFKDTNPVVKIRLLQVEPDNDVPDFEEEDSQIDDEMQNSSHQALSRRGSRAAVVLSSSPVVSHPAARHASQPRMSPVVLRMASPSKRSGSTPAQRSPMIPPGSPAAFARAAGSPSRMRTTGPNATRMQLLDDLLAETSSPLGEEAESRLLAAIDRYSISYTELQFGEKIGSGTFGDVFLGRWHGAVVAIKLSRAVSKKQRLDFLNEILIMTALTAHPHLITLMGICLNGEYPALVLEYADGGTLEKYVHHHAGNLSELEIVRIAREIALGMRHLHRSGVIHRDLAIRNVLLNGSSPPTCKISDFGLSRQWDSERSMTDSTSGLPIRWMSPESLDTREYSFASDSWAYGCLLVELLTGKVPYHEIGDLDVGIQIRDTNIVPTLPPHTPSIITSICKACWDRNPSKRPSFDVISEVLLSYKPL